MKSTAKVSSVSMPAELLAKVQAAAAAEGRSFSNYVCNVLRLRLFGAPGESNESKPNRRRFS
jgi:hypothetical protein